MKNESILDKPKQDLDASVWRKDGQQYHLTEDAEKKINDVVSWIQNRIGVSLSTIHITGSITSNQYSDKSDVDVHFSSKEIRDYEELNRTVRNEFDEMHSSDLSKITIGTHKIEIYFQENLFQDFMSVGCYDFIGKKWLVGPEFLPLDYDPYSEYYNKDMIYVKSVVDDIRNIILEIYELIIVILNSSDDYFKENLYSTLQDKIEKGSLVFTNAREFRKVYSSPTSIQDALQKRSSVEWRVADSAFKLLDKFGYLEILREISKAQTEITSGEKSIQDVVPVLSNVIQNSIMHNTELQKTDKMVFEDMQNEGLGNKIAIISTIAAMLFVPNVMNAQTLHKELTKIPNKHLRMRDKLVTKAINKSTTKNQIYNGLSRSNLINMVATVTYDEGMVDYISENAKGKTYDDRVLQAIIWTIINRANKDPNKFADVILEKNQYFGAKHIVGSKDSDFRIYHPGVGYDKKTWRKCNEFAALAIDGKLPLPVDDNGVSFGNRNMIANKSIDNEESYESWGSSCDFTLGGNTNHCYGYDKSHDPNKSLKKKTKPTYKIKAGDTLSQIAKKFKTTTQKIMKDNPKIKDQNKIQVGSIIFI